MLCAAICDAEALSLPHQVQRIIRLTGLPGVLAGQPVREQALAALTRLDMQLAAGGFVDRQDGSSAQAGHPPGDAVLGEAGRDGG
jgi:hypothetical protein